MYTLTPNMLCLFDEAALQYTFTRNNNLPLDKQHQPPPSHSSRSWNMGQNFLLRHRFFLERNTDAKGSRSFVITHTHAPGQRTSLSAISTDHPVLYRHHHHPHHMCIQRTCPSLSLNFFLSFSTTHTRQTHLDNAGV